MTRRRPPDRTSFSNGPDFVNKLSTPEEARADERHRLTTFRRQKGIPMHVHLVFPWNLKPRNLSLLGSDQMDNLLKAHI